MGSEMCIRDRGSLGADLQKAVTLGDRDQRSRSQYLLVCLFVCFDHRVFTPASTPKGVDFCVHGPLYSRLKDSCAPTSGKCMLGMYL